MSVEIYLSTVFIVLSVYLLVGVLLFFPIGYLAWRSIGNPKGPFWADCRENIRWRYVPVQIFLWPVALWDVLT